MFANNNSLYISCRLEETFIKALREFFPKLKTDEDKADFFAVYKKEAEEYDREFTKKYDEDLNTTLIFVRSFSWFRLVTHWPTIRRVSSLQSLPRS